MKRQYEKQLIEEELQEQKLLEEEEYYDDMLLNECDEYFKFGPREYTADTDQPHHHEEG